MTKPISVTNKFKPFSHQPGISIPFPLLQLVFVVYPSKIKVIDHRANQKVLMTFKFKYKTPCKKFTAFYDLKKYAIQIQAQLEDNFVQFSLSFDPQKKHFTLTLDRFKEEHLIFEVKRPNKTNIISRRLTTKKPLILLKDLEVSPPRNLELLFLGCQKKQEIERIFDRKDPREFLPLWFLWGQYSPQKMSRGQKEGTLVFLSDLQEKLINKQHDQITPFLKNMFSASFAPMMVPYLEDFKHWGFYLPRLTSSKVSPWQILGEIYKVVREFFVSSKANDLYILPHLPPELFSGKLVKVKEGNLNLHFEWTKKMIRRMIIFASKNTKMYVHFQNQIKRFRLRSSKTGPGKLYENHCEIEFKKNKYYYFDRFEK